MLSREWTKDTPRHWRRAKLKYLATLKSGDSITSESIAEDGPFPVFGGNGLRGYTDAFTHTGDHVLVGRQGALCGNINYASGQFWASEHAIVVTPKHGDDVTWLGELLRFMNLNQLSQSAAQPGIAAHDVANLDIVVPPPDEQRAIAAYIRDETARLDALVAVKERLLGLLAEKRRALITRAVTRGLDPHAPLRGSGIPWLGQIPAHWEVRRAKFLFHQSAVPVRDKDEIVTCFRDGQVTLRGNRRTEGFTQADLEVGYQGIRRGQLVLHSMDAFAGAIGVSDSDGKCSPEYIICDPLNGRSENEYYGHLLRTMALAGFILAMCPAVRERAPRIRFTNFGEMQLPVAPVEEQREVVSQIQEREAQIGALATRAQQTVGLLKERRAGIIAATVTGQINVERAA